MPERPLLVFALEFPLGFGGGVSVLVRALLHGLRNEFRFALISPDSLQDLAALPEGALIEHHLSWPVSAASRARAQELAATIAAWRPALVHFHAGGNYGWGNRRPGTSPIPLLKARGIPSLTTVHLVVTPLHFAMPQEWPRWKQLLASPVAWLGRIAALAAGAGEIAVSRHDLTRLRRWYFPFRSRFRRIYHSRLPEQSQPTITPTARLPEILHVGHRARRKGQHRLLQAFAHLAPRFPEWRLHLVGPPAGETFEAELRALIEKHALQDRVILAPSLPEPEIAGLMRQAAVYVQPSLEEALGLALQEALFHGMACIGTTAGGIPKLITHEQNGLLCPPDDPLALAAALERLLAFPTFRTRLSEAASASIRTRGMTAEAMTEAHRKLYRSLLSS